MSATETASVQWATRRLGDITQVRTGKLDANAQRPGGPYPFFTCGEETLEIDHFAFDTEAILLAGNGNFNVKWYHGKFNAYQRTYVIEPNGVYGKWLFYAVQAALRTITKGNRGSVIRFIRIGDIVDSTVCVPPSYEQQRRIVAEIEKQFTRLEAGVAALRRVQANLKRYRAAVLKAACEGQLVPTELERLKAEGRRLKDFESGEQLLKRILAERRQHWTGRGQYKEPAAPDTANLPPLPSGWTWTSFDQTCVAVSDEGKKVPKADFLAEGKFPVIDQGESFVGGYSNNEELIFTGALPVILFGDHTRRFKLVSERFVVGADGVKLIGPTGAWNVKFLWYQFQQLDFEDRGYSRHFQFVRKESLKLPPIAEQTRIVAEVERRLSVVEELESVVSANLQRATRLRQSILQRAFEGKLCSQ